MTQRALRGTLDLVGQGAAASPASESVWERTVVGWHIAFWAVLGIALAATTAGFVSDGGDARHGTAAAALVGLGVAYAVLAVPAVADRSPRRARAYLAALCLVVGVAFSSTAQAGFLLFIAYPQVWFFSGRKREGAAWTVALTVVAATAMVLRVGTSPEVLREVGLTFAVSLVLSILLGLWIASVIDQSQQRADLIRELESTRGELAEANHAAGVMAERARVAQEIHDTLTQGLTSIVMLSQTAHAHIGTADHPATPTLELIETTARENLAETRALVAAFAPVALEDSTLAAALHRLAARFATETGVRVDVEIAADTVAALRRDGEVVLLRAAQEALSNVRRHAGASHVRLRLTGGHGEAGIDVVDDGAGFGPDRPPGFGLAGMRRRVEEIGGTLAVDSDPGQGTHVSARIPAEDGGGAG